MTIDRIRQVRKLTRAKNWPDFVDELAYHQFAHETGDFTSRLFLEDNNISGMRPAQQRKKYYTGVTKSNFAIYETVGDSIADYWDRQFVFGIDHSSPMAYIDSTLASGYSDGVKAYKVNWASRSSSTLSAWGESPADAGPLEQRDKIKFAVVALVAVAMCLNVKGII